MYKHRDNIAFAPATVDPNGTGLQAQATPAVAGTAGPTVAGAPTTAGARKRGRDIRGIDRFRQVVFGENGFPRLHAMATRNPTLMYPPDDIQEARKRYQARQRLEEEQQQRLAGGSPGNGGSGVTPGVDGAVMVHGPQARAFEADDAALWAMFDERHEAEAEDKSKEEASTAPELVVSTPALDDQVISENPIRDEQLATYHHRQLDTFLRMVYEFNHTTFVKLPMQDTLSLLARCGKEAVAHVLEHEMHLRMAREGKLRELKELKEMREKLSKRSALVQEESEERLLAEAERMQAMLDQQEGAELVFAPADVAEVPDRDAGPRVSFAELPDRDHSLDHHVAKEDTGEAQLPEPSHETVEPAPEGTTSDAAAAEVEEAPDVEAREEAGLETLVVAALPENDDTEVVE